jgi:hypothetical protein
MYIEITSTQQPIFEEKLSGLQLPEGYSAEHMIYVIYQFQSKTLFSESVYKKVESIYFAADTDQEIPRKIWTNEMIVHSHMRESTVPRKPRNVRYTGFGKALFTLLLVLILVLGFLALRSIHEMKKAKTKTTINLSDKTL